MHRTPLPQDLLDTLFPTLEAPPIKTKPKEWWSAMDKHTVARYDPKKPLPSHQYRNQPLAFYSELLNEDVLLEIVNARRLTAVMQHDRSSRYVDLLTDPEHPFEDVWTSLSPEEQETHFLAGFAANEKTKEYTQFTQGKADCPELTRDMLAGHGFIDLLRQCVLSDNRVPTRPMIIENARFNAIIGYVENDKSQTRTAVYELIRMTRTNYITSFVFATVASFKGVEISYELFATEHSKTKSTLKGNKEMIEAMMGGKAAGKSFMKEEAKRRKDMSLYCHRCLKREGKDVDQKMMVCVKCKAIGRETRYCSRDCQVAEWKSHKKHCGKPLDAAAALEDLDLPQAGSSSTPQGRSDIPPCPTGHRRTPHVIRHIEDLEVAHTKDFVVRTSGTECYGVALDEVLSTAVFLHMRNILFTSTAPGAEWALLYIYRVLQTAAPEQALQKQLQREYGMDLWKRMQTLLKGSPPYMPPKISRAELEVMIECLKKDTTRFTEELSGYVAGEGDSSANGVAVGPKKDVIVEAEFPKNAAPPAVVLVPSKKKKAVGAQAIGPNFKIPTPVDHLEDRFKHSDYCAIDEQIKYLQMNPQADYMIWGHPDSPNAPMGLQFWNLQDALLFVYHRTCLFKYGPYNLESLAHLIMSLRPILQRKKITPDMLYDQLAREYSRAYVNTVLGMISKRTEPSGREVEVFTSTQGNKFVLGKLPMRYEDTFRDVMYELKEVDRFPELTKLAADRSNAPF